MRDFWAFVTGIGIGVMFGGLMTMVSFAPDGTLSACRAAHPGYDCDIGWVVGEAFK